MKRWKKILLAGVGLLAGVASLLLVFFYFAYHRVDMSGVEEIGRAAAADLARVAQEVELARTTETLAGMTLARADGKSSDVLRVEDRREVNFFEELSRLDAAYRALSKDGWPKLVRSRMRPVGGQFAVEKVSDVLRGKDEVGRTLLERAQEWPRQVEAMERFFRWQEARDESEKNSVNEASNRRMPMAEQIAAAHRLLDEVEDFLLRTEWRIETGDEAGEWDPAPGRMIQPTMLCIARACREGDETKARLIYLRAIDMVTILSAAPRSGWTRISVSGLSMVYAHESRNASAGLREASRRLECFRMTREQAKVRFLADLRREGEASIRRYEGNTVYHRNVLSKLDKTLNQIFVIAPVRALHTRALDAIEREDVRKLNSLKTQASVFGSLVDGDLDSFFRRFENLPEVVHPEWKKMLKLETVFTRFTENSQIDWGRVLLACLAYQSEHGSWPDSMSDISAGLDGLTLGGEIERRPVEFAAFRYPLINRFGTDTDNGPKLDPFSKAVQAFVDEHGRVPTEAAELRNVQGRPYFDETVARERFENFPGFWSIVGVRRGEFKQDELEKIMAERGRDLSAPPTVEELARLYGTDEGLEIVTIEGVAISKRGTGIENGEWLNRKTGDAGKELERTK